MPFLLGSGGTLVFDMTIMGQACMYAGLSPKHRGKDGYLDAQEDSGLLARDSQADLHESWQGGDDLEGRHSVQRV